MKINDRIHAFHQLGNAIKTMDQANRQWLGNEARQRNAWFTSNAVELALDGISRFLDASVLTKWTTRYPQNSKEKTVGLVMAGNIPLVGFHDYLCVLMSGHKLHAKLSSQDSFLITWLHEKLVAIEPAFAQQVLFAERLDKVEAVIATGSDNTARYFEFYFRNIPHLIRKNRTSVALLSGKESNKDLMAFGTDVFSYFGLGCRNVAKLYVPSGYDFKPLFESWSPFNAIIHHHKYANNYDYQKSIMLVNKVQFMDTGFVMAKEDEALVSPISVVYFEQYSTVADALTKLNENKNKIQCIVSNIPGVTEKKTFGQAQFPEVDDYADGVDTMHFLTNL